MLTNDRGIARKITSKLPLKAIIRIRKPNIRKTAREIYVQVGQNDRVRKLRVDCFALEWLTYATDYVTGVIVDSGRRPQHMQF
jgi:hypothetical protein